MLIEEYKIQFPIDHESVSQFMDAMLAGSVIEFSLGTIHRRLTVQGVATMASWREGPRVELVLSEAPVGPVVWPDQR